jgi:long-chain acyl-CoA synthetase
MTVLYDWLIESAKARGNNKALVYRDNYLSWRGLLHRVDRRAQEFKSMGIEAGAWVGLMLGNVPDFVILALALSKLRAAIVPIDPTTGSRELELIMTAAPMRAMVTRPRGSEATASSPGAPSPLPTVGRRRAEEEEEELEEVPEIRRRLQGTLLTCSVYKRDTPQVSVEPLAIMLTADSLGDPKGVLRTAENYTAMVDTMVHELRIDASSRILAAVPLFHAYGWDIGLLPVLRTGATMFLEEEVSARRVGKILRDHNIDVLPGTPLMYAELSRLPTAKPLAVEDPRFLSGGSQLAPDVAEAFRSKYEVPLLSCYHTTECGIVSIDHSGKAAKTVGTKLRGTELRLTDTSGAKVPVGKKGLIWVRSAAVSPESVGPYRDVESPAAGDGLVPIGESDAEGWFRTGDLGKLDKSGRLTLLGREDDVVKVDGKRVALGEVEGCLEAFPKVKAARACIVTDPFAGSMVVARVVAAARCEAEELIDHCARNLAPYKVPRRIEFCERI